MLLAEELLPEIFLTEFEEDEQEKTIYLPPRGRELKDIWWIF